MIALKEGTLLYFGAYEIKKKLGQGGFGITYLAWHTALDKYVAIKEFFPQMLCGRDGDTNHITLGTQSNGEVLEDLKKKFIKEAKNIAKLSHPNIIKIHTFFEENNTAYYVMDYIEGESLSDLVKHRGPLPEFEATHYIRQVGDALSYLHNHNMTHLDVKPGNIMLKEGENTPILIDFGLSKNYDTTGMQTTTRGNMGISPGFSPIEQYSLTGVKAFSPKSDLYSLAATYYYLLSGIVPAEATLNPADSLEFPSGVSPAVRNAIAKAMSYGAAQRHESVHEFLRRLDDKEDENTLIINGEESTRLIDNQEKVINTNAPNSQAPVKPKNNNALIYAAVGIIIVLIAILLAVLLGEKDKGDPYVSDISDTANAEVSSVILDPPSEQQQQTVYNQPAVPSEPAKTAEPQNPFGPFADKTDLINYIERYYQEGGYINSNYSYLAPTITTDYVAGSTPKKFSRNEFAQKNVDHNARHGIIDYSHDINHGSVKATPLPDGGVEVSFTQIYEMTKDKDGAYWTGRYNCDETFKINRNREIFYIKERNTKIGEYYN